MGNSVSITEKQPVEQVKSGTPGPRPYSSHFKKLQQQQEMSRQTPHSSSSSSKLSCSSKFSNYNTNYEEPAKNRREALRNGQTITNLNATESMKNFLKIQYELDNLDKDGIFDSLKSVEINLQILHKNRNEAESIYRTLLDKSRCDNNSSKYKSSTVESYYLSNAGPAHDTSQEEHEFLTNLNLLEMAENEYKQVNTQYQQSKKIHAHYKKEYKKAVQLQDEQMSILYSIFQGDYGSELEENLENDLRVLTENKDQLKSALIKYVQSRSLIIYSYNKLQHAEEKWLELMGYDIKNSEKVYCATEVRNSLASAYHYLNNTRSYLKNEDMPFCGDQDLKNLLYQAASVYNEMSTPDRQRNVLKNVQIMRKRCLALSQWFEEVIKMFMPLMTKYSQVSAQFDRKKEELKLERIRLLDDIIRNNPETDEKSSFKEALIDESVLIKSEFNTPTKSDKLTTHHSLNELKKLAIEKSHSELSISSKKTNDPIGQVDYKDVKASSVENSPKIAPQLPTDSKELKPKPNESGVLKSTDSKAPSHSDLEMMKSEKQKFKITISSNDLDKLDPKLTESFRGSLGKSKSNANKPVDSKLHRQDSKQSISSGGKRSEKSLPIKNNSNGSPNNRKSQEMKKNSLPKEDDDFPGVLREGSRFDLPLPPSRDQILIHVEQIKQRYKQQEEEWNKLLSKSRQSADDRLNNILESYK